MKSMSNIIVLAAWAISIAACGGGGGSTPAPLMPPPLSSDASLSSLSVTGGTLDPAFSPAVTNYTATVPFGSSSVDVSVTTSDGNASLMINGSNNATVALTVGDNTISIVVTAEDSTTTRTYTIVVTRLPSDDASLSFLSVSSGTLDPAFSPAVTNYTATVPFLSNSVDVSATTSDDNASFMIDGSNNATVALTVGDNTISIVVTAENSTTTRTYTIVVTRLTFAQEAYIKASNTDGDDRFGQSVALSGDGNTLAVGARNEESAAIGVNGDQADNSEVRAGAVYVFTRESGGVWTQQAYVKASNTDGGDQFGSSVALSGDGNTLAVGAGREDNAATGVNGKQADNSAVNAGAVYVFTRDSGGVWTQQAYVKASNTDGDDRFGQSVTLSGDGNTLAVGAVQESGAATGVNGDQADNSEVSAGAVYVFTRDGGGVWTQQAYVKASNTDASDQFGRSVALSGDGNTLAVGAVQESSAATGVNGIHADNSAVRAGAVYVFTRDGGGVWTQQAYVKASNTDASDQFGSSVALSGDGNTLAVGAIQESSAATASTSSD